MTPMPDWFAVLLLIAFAGGLFYMLKLVIDAAVGIVTGARSALDWLRHLRTTRQDAQ
jgi:hypothetical protein